MNPAYTSSIKRKVMMVILMASIAVLLVTVVAFVVYDLATYRRAMVQNLVSQGRLIAENSAAALAFNDQKGAARVLSSLRAAPHVTAAAVYDQNGFLFATYPAGLTNGDLPSKPARWTYRFQNHSLCIFQPVVYSGARLGTIYLQSDLKVLTERLQLYGAISLIIMLVAFLVALLLSNMLQRRISRPIVALAETASAISDRRDYSIRALKLSDDELGLLTDSFNNMLEKIQGSDSALRAREAQFRLVTNHAPVLLAQLDRQYRYKFANEPYASYFGRQPEEIIGKPAVEVVGAEQFETERPNIDRVLAGHSAQFELESVNPQHERRWSHVEYTPEKNAEGTVVGFVAVYTDVTLRKQAEMEMKRARDQALAASRAKDDFLAALSHELRTPLNPVLLIASDAAADPQLPPEIRRDFDTISKNIELEARLIDDLLDLTRITRGKLSLNLRPVNVHEILQDAISNVQGEMTEKSIEFTRDLTAGPAVVEGDSVRLQQIFWNVLKNAVKFTPQCGSISLRTWKDGSRLNIRISDSGIGMTPEELDRVFGAFSQGEHAVENSHRFGGLGLGLAISRQLVELHHGRISAFSGGRDQGASFTIELPT